MSGEQTPLWRWLAVGLLFSGMAGYMLVTGELAINKARSMFITRAADPVAYWASVLIFATFGVLALRRTWLKVRSG